MKKKKKKFKLKKSHKYTILFVLFMLSIYLIQVITIKYNKSPVIIHPETEKYEVYFNYIFDGDTAVFINKEDMQEIICRFLAVDAPEIDEEGYDEAKSFSNMKLRNAKNIILEIEPHSEKYDKFERLLAWVWVDEELLQAALIEKQLVEIAYVYDEYLYTAYLKRLQENVTK